ncbi:MAG TPA: ATP-binding protein [Terriglobales bacterium]|jgi:hypothetical protein|nr:ATP-binding protein [Terriglobales bacterium]
MSIYSRPLSHLGTGDLQELLDNKAVENVHLEFKREDPGKDEIMKKISSFGNTFGGYIVVGAKAKSGDGRIEELTGIDEVPGYKQRLIQWSFDAVTPPLTLEVSEPIPVPAATGKVAYVIFVPESDVAPHFLNDRKGVWVRTDEFSQRFEARLADEIELRHLLDRRKLILERRDSLVERAKARFEAFARSTSEPSDGTKRSLVGPRLSFSVGPRFPARALRNHGELTSLIMKNHLNWRSGIFPDFTRGNLLTQHESAVVVGPSREQPYSIFECNVWGMLFYCTPVAEEHYQVGWGIHLYEFVGHILLFLHHAGEMLNALGYPSGPIVIQAVLSSLIGTPWLYSPGGMPVMFMKKVLQLDNDITFSVPTTSEALREKHDGVAMEVLRYVFFGVNWADLNKPETLEGLVRSGYTFNSWPEPPKLRA